MIYTKYWTKNPYMFDGKFITGSAFTGFFLHSVATAQSDAQVFISGRDKENYTSSGVNGFIDDKGSWVTAPSLEKKGTVKRMPHAGRPANDRYIGFEMCEPKQIVYNQNHTKIIDCTDFNAAYAYVKKVYVNAVELFASLCKFHGKDPLGKNVILSHKEGHDIGIATNHGDPNQIWSYFDKSLTMDRFRADVSKKMQQMIEDEKKQEALDKLEDEIMATFVEQMEKALNMTGSGDKPSPWAKNATEKAKEYGFFSGNGKGDFGWQLPITREQLAAVIVSVYEKVSKETDAKIAKAIENLR